jgi:hypothetical protein
MSALEPTGNDVWLTPGPAAKNRLYRMCVNYAQEQVCNWMVPAEDPAAFCRACRLNQIIPNLDQPNHRQYWAKLEAAKRHVLYTLYHLGLAVVSKEEDSGRGLAFAFLADKTAESEFTDPIGDQSPIHTGHANGLITINVAEADDIASTRMRTQMNEEYRTLLGHFRHEIGHFYWERLIKASPHLQTFRRLYGDETQDYNQALRTYYENGPPDNWSEHYLSAYATAHPWEDWAESWAHYLHMIDTLDTAHAYGLIIQGYEVGPVGTSQSKNTDDAMGFTALVDGWIRLSVVINALNRSVGIGDANPFVLSEPARQKLRFVHDIIATAGKTERQSATNPG